MQYALPNRHIAGLGGYDYHGDGGGGGMPLTAAARRAFWQTRRASTSRACPPVHTLAIVDIGFSTGVVVGCALFQGVPAAGVYRLSSQGRHSPTRFRRDGMSGLRS